MSESLKGCRSLFSRAEHTNPTDLSEFELEIEATDHDGIWQVGTVGTEDGLIVFERARYTDPDTQLISIGIVEPQYKIKPGNGYNKVPLSDLSEDEIREFNDYLERRLANETILGTRWVCFRSDDAEKPLLIFGPNYTVENFEGSEQRVRKFQSSVNTLFSKKPSVPLFIYVLIVLAALGLGGYIFMTQTDIGKQWLVAIDNLLSGRPSNNSPGQQIDSKAMRFYAMVFPDVYQWLLEDDQKQRDIAKDVLKPEYIDDLLRHTQRSFWTSENVITGTQGISSTSAQFSPKGVRLILFDFFNYNEELKVKWNQYNGALTGTTFGEWYRRLSFIGTDEPIYHNVLYYQVGDLNLPTIQQLDTYLAQHYVDGGYTKSTESEIYNDLPIQEVEVKNQLRDLLNKAGFLITPLRVVNSDPSYDWYLATVISSTAKQLTFAAFFNVISSTLVPQDIARQLLQQGNFDPSQEVVSWYKVSASQAQQLNLGATSNRYFQVTDQGFIQALESQIRDMALTQAPATKVEVERKLMLGSGEDGYGLQTNDPIIWLLLTKLIQAEEFGSNPNQSELNRNVVDIHMTSVQLARRPYASGTQHRINPGLQKILDQFTAAKSFVAILVDGKEVEFTNVNANLFSPNSFFTTNDEVIFITKEGIDQMEIVINGTSKFRVLQVPGNTYRLVAN